MEPLYEQYGLWFESYEDFIIRYTSIIQEGI